MSFIQVKNVPPALHEAVRRRAAAEGVTISEYVREVLERELALPSRREWLLRVASRQSVDVDTIRTIDAVRAEREDELARSRR